MKIYTIYEYTITSFIHTVYHSVTEIETLHRLQSEGELVFILWTYILHVGDTWWNKQLDAFHILVEVWFIDITEATKPSKLYFRISKYQPRSIHKLFVHILLQYI